MSDRERLRRDDPERDQPQRSWFDAFGAAPGGGDGDAGGARPGGIGSDWQRVVEQGVRIGYEVIDAQIREGRRVAEQVNARIYGAGTSTDGARAFTDGLFRTYADLASRWLDMMAAVAGGVSASAGNGTARSGPADHAGAAPARQGTEPVAIEVDSKRPITVTLDLRPGAATLRLGSQPLADPDPQKPSLRDVLLEPPEDDHPMLVRIRVPDLQPAGTYSAVVYEREAGRPQGTLSVTIPETPPAETGTPS